VKGVTLNLNHISPDLCKKKHIAQVNGFSRDLCNVLRGHEMADDCPQVLQVTGFEPV